MSITDADLLHFNQQGIIPGPTESEESFLKRTDYCLQLQALCYKGDIFPGCESGSDSAAWLSTAHQITKPLFDIEPTWLPVAFSNYGLHPWHAGCAWIFQELDTTPTGAIMQLRTTFKHKDKYLGLYSRDELIAHEMSHVGRMMYTEPKFEEVLAYRTSHSCFRRWLGPIVQKSWESLVFMSLMIFLLLFDLFLIVSGEMETFPILLGAKLLPVILIAAVMVRNSINQHIFQDCLVKLTTICSDQQIANAIIYRLTDKEIILFSKSTPEQILSYAQSQTSLRWRLITIAYLAGCAVLARK